MVTVGWLAWGGFIGLSASQKADLRLDAVRVFFYAYVPNEDPKIGS
jgi:hypothetical protein